jgi:hypothetical protein
MRYTESCLAGTPVAFRIFVMSKTVQRDLKTLGGFIEIYCHHHHADAEKAVVQLRLHDVTGIVGHPVILCEECTKLLTHAFVKRSHCPMDPKPQCKHCPNHCYAPKYRQQIQEVMRFSGMKAVMTGKLHYLFHLLF